MRHLDLFSGIGGFALAARWMGWQTVAFCEIEDYPKRVLAKNFPGVPIHDDIHTLDAKPYGGQVDLISGGFPCQDISSAGKKHGINGKRSALWSELARVISEVRPRFVVVENVAELLSRGLCEVLGDLAALGYDAEWHCIPASYVGAPFSGRGRDRIWIVAFPNSERLERPRIPREEERQPLAGLAWGNRFSGRLSNAKPDHWKGKPGVSRVAHGVPDRVDRIRALGNAIVPQVALEIFRAIDEAVRQSNDSATQPTERKGDGVVALAAPQEKAK